MADKTAPDKRRITIRRSQAERSSSTRWRACEATLEGLAEFGHERISTTMIAQKAKISRGALTHQFPTRQELFVAALRHLHEDWERNSPVALPMNHPVVPMSELTEQLWKTMFDDRRYIAAVELMLAARQDNELGRILRAEMARWIKIRDDSLLRLLGHGPGDSSATKLLHLTLSVLRGIAVHRSFDQNDKLAPELLSLWVSMLAQGDMKCNPGESYAGVGTHNR